MEHVIEAKNLSFIYEKEPILKDISFEITKGNIVAIVGPNGSGKTTLLKALLGFLAPQRGSITVFGKPPSQIREKVGYVPQHFEFDRSFPITVLEFLKVSCSGCSEEKIREYLSHLGVEGIPQERLGSLSGGQLQRVLVVRAMLHDPEILYLDEPASGIDVGGERDFYQLISHIHQDHGTTIIMVSHEIDVVYAFADQVICVNRKLVCSGVPTQVLTPEVLHELYGKDTTLYHHKEKHPYHRH